MKVQFYLVLLFSCFFFGQTLGQVNSQIKAEGICKKSVEVLYLTAGGQITGELISTTEDLYILRDKNGTEFQVPSALVTKSQEKCLRKNWKKLEKNAVKPGFTHEFSFGQQFGLTKQKQYYYNCCFGDCYFYSNGHYMPRASVEHHVSLELIKGFGLRGGLGLTQFSSYSGYSQTVDAKKFGLITIPVYLGVQQHFWTGKKIHPYLKADYGRSVANLMEQPESYENERVIGRASANRVFQAHIGVQHTLLDKKAVFVEFGLVRQSLETEFTTFYTNNNGSYTSSMPNSFSKWSLRSGFTF